MARMAEADAIKTSLEQAFTKVWCERMDGVPILNSRLNVEAVGMCEWNAHWLCVLVTPWFINLMLLPQEATPSWSGLKTGEKMLHRFPSGRFEFIAGEEGELGRYLMCSLFSPVLEFEDQEAARIAAVAARDALFDAGLDPDAEKQKAKAEAAEAGAGGQTTVAPEPLSRRGFLSGRSNPADGSA
jgi:[NiFe] hydrogenase assembly HybE family chaperone